MSVSLTSLTSPLVKSAVLDDVGDLLGRAFGRKLELDPGSPVAGILDAVVGWFVDDAWNPIIVPALRAPFLDFATGDWLSLVADLVYNRPRIGAQAGTQVITFENRSSLGAVAQASGTVRVKAIAPSIAAGKTYTTTTPLNIIAWPGTGAYPTGTATVEADVAGTGSNAFVGDLGTFATGTPLVSGPNGCWVLSMAGSITGTDEESDESLVVRCRVAVSEASDMGPRAEYTSIALDPVGAFTRRDRVPPVAWGTGQPAISRVAVLEPGNSVVNVYLASASGPAAGDMVTLGSDVNKAYVAILAFVVPPGTTCNVYAATAHSISTLTAIVLTISGTSNVSQPEAIAFAAAGLVDFFANLPIGGTRTVNGGSGYVFALAVSRACWGPGIVEVNLGAFVDVLLAANDVATFAVPTNIASLITANIVAQGN